MLYSVHAVLYGTVLYCTVLHCTGGVYSVPAVYRQRELHGLGARRGGHRVHHQHGAQGHRALRVILHTVQGVPEYSQHYISYVVQVPASRGADRPHGGGDLGLPRDRDQGADGPAAVDRLYFIEEIDCIS